MSLYKNGVWTSSNNYESEDIYNKKYITGDMSDYSAGAGGWTKTVKGSYTNYRHNNTKPTSNSWPNLACPVFNFVIGDKYLWRCWVRCNTCTAGASLHMRAARIKNDWVTSTINVCSPSLADGKWHEYYLIQTIPETFDRSGTTVTSAPVFEMYTSNLKDATTDTVTIDFDIKDIEIFHSSKYASQAAFYEADEEKAKMYKDELRSNSFIEI